MFTQNDYDKNLNIQKCFDLIKNQKINKEIENQILKRKSELEELTESDISLTNFDLLQKESLVHTKIPKGSTCLGVDEYHKGCFLDGMSLHRAFCQFEEVRWEGYVNPSFTANYFGVFTNDSFVLNEDGKKQSEGPIITEWQRPSWPPNKLKRKVIYGSDFFAHISLLESILLADQTYNIFELGAGYGKWISNGYAGVRRLRKDIQSIRIVGVEAEPTHYEMMQQHIKNNKIPISSTLLLHAIVSDKDGEQKKFKLSDPYKDWGQSVIDDDDDPRPTLSVMTVSLKYLLFGYSVVDLINIDVQGYEWNVLKNVGEEITMKVKRIHVETHTPELENMLREFFNSLGWYSIYDYGGDKVRDTPYGPIHFTDGIQGWINPNFHCSHSI